MGTNHHDWQGGASHQPLDTLTVEVLYHLEFGDVVIDKACFRDLGPVSVECFSPEQVETWQEAIETERALYFADAEEQGREWYAAMAADARRAA
jgi:hypothetical protein